MTNTFAVLQIMSSASKFDNIFSTLSVQTISDLTVVAEYSVLRFKRNWTIRQIHFRKQESPLCKKWIGS